LVPFLPEVVHLRGTVTHYSYTPSPLPHMGGTDAVTVYNGKILISASSPGTTGKASASTPAVYAVTLNTGTKTAAVAPFFAANATATGVNAPNDGKKVTLALTDPDSNTLVPSSSPAFAGDFMLNAQADQQLIFSDSSGSNLQVLKITKPVDDTTWATSASGSLYTTDSNADTVDAITGSFKPGTVYTAIAPCNAANAPRSSALIPPAGHSTPWHDQPEGRRGRHRYGQRGARAQGPDLRPLTSTT
jgi:hypothetical protein